MRITSVILGIQLLCSTLLLASESTAQTISLDVRRASITDIFKAIEKQAGVQFTYNEQTIDGLAPVTLKVSVKPINEVLKSISMQVPLQFKQNGNLIGVQRIENKKASIQTPVIQDIASPPADVTGKVTDKEGKSLPGATIRVKGRNISTTTDNEGNFTIKNLTGDAILQVSYIGFKAVEVPVNGLSLHISLEADDKALQEIAVVSTGYQKLPKERATGSFAFVGNALLDRRVSMNILDKIENVVPGILFDRTATAPDPISIRGRSTILADASPLIVVDNFPFDGAITDINVNDVESVTILKDAAAASIWGARAGNGVIVITTKKGSDGKPKVNFSTNVTFVPRPDPSSLRTVNSADFVDLEKYLFSKGYYAADEASLAHSALTPAVELLIAKRDGKIPAASADAQIEALKNYDANKQIQQYLYKPGISQQHQLNISGGSSLASYYFSAGFDKPANNLVGLGATNRLSLRSNNNFQITKQLSVEAGINYIQGITKGGVNPGYNLTAGGLRGLYPYAQLVDKNGNPTTITQNYRDGFITEAMQKGLLDWTYNPINNINASVSNAASRDIVFKTGLNYKVLPFLSAHVIYQYQYVSNSSDFDNGADSYYVRNLVNQFTQVSGTGQLTRPIPVGNILISRDNYIKAHQGRAQLNFDQVFGKHSVTALGGMELREQKRYGNSDQFYGYNPISSSIVKGIDYSKTFPQYNNTGSSAAIPNIQDYDMGTIDHLWSYFANASYSYDQKYIVSASARSDASNLFGVKTNQKGVPLWSAGLAWQLNRESFYKLDWLPRLKIRATYGEQGNFSRAVSALTTASYTTTSTGMVYATIVNPPNESLKWEKVKTYNLGLDFSLKNDRISGSIEYYNKRASDLMGSAPIDPTTGLSSGTFYGNVANMSGHGFDVQLNSRNLTGVLQWNTTALFSYSASYVSKYFMPVSTLGQSYLTAATTNPVEGKPVYSLYAYRWNGLDPQTGSPIGYLSGAPSQNYASITSTTPLSDMVYGGNMTPQYYGSVRNDFFFKNVSLSFNISFKAGYYFRRTSVNYTNQLARWSINSDYSQRWQQPGDELRTSVPSLVYPLDNNRDSFYTNSEVLIEKGDHIRFEDISLGYDLTKRSIPRLPVTRARVYLYANNIGPIWTANKYKLDPNFLNIPTLKATIAIGLNVTL